MGERETLRREGQTGVRTPLVRPAGRRASRLPTFIVIGAMKTGTTSLFHYLRAHPQVFMSPLKEVDFFIEEGNWFRGLDWYRKQFAGAGDDAIAVGEASTAYTKVPEFMGVPDRIADCIPDTRLIYLIRDPIDRIRSHYQHRALIGAERSPFDDAVINDPRYVDCSRYALQIDQYLDRFPRERILIVTSEALRSDRAPTMRQVYRFLGVDEAFVSESFDREFYRTEERASYPPFVWWIRRTVKRYVPAGKRAKELIDRLAPASLQRVRASQPVVPPAAACTVSESIRARLEDLLRDDVGKLRSYLPEGFDGWGIG
jgi:Sulfotransferase domain